MGKMYSVNVFPLSKIVKRYGLNQDTFFDIIFDFLSHRREEVLNLRLFQRYGSAGERIKEEIRPILYTLLDELKRSDNVEGYFITNHQFYVKDGDLDYDHHTDDRRSTETNIRAYFHVSRRPIDLIDEYGWDVAER